MFIAPGGKAIPYQIPNSLRFRASNSAYLSRTFGSPTSATLWTWSGWVKRGTLGSQQILLGTGSSAGPMEFFDFDSSDRFHYTSQNSGSTNVLTKVSTRRFRDPTAHIHLVVQKNASATSGVGSIKVWANNEEVTTWDTNAYSGGSSVVDRINSAVAHEFGRFNSTNYLDGYLSEINFIDGQALTPSSFGETNSDGVWVPKKYTGTYGTNGFYLDFKTGTSATTLSFDHASGSYSENLSIANGSNIGGMTAGGGLASAFDGNYAQALGASATSASVVSGYSDTNAIGKDWGAGVTKTITAFRIVSPTDRSFCGLATANFKLQGSNNGSTWDDLYTGSSTTSVAQVIAVTSGITTSTAYRYHRVNISGNGTNSTYMTELEFYEAGSYQMPNNWYPTNISTSPGTSYDWMYDTPTNNYPTASRIDQYGATFDYANLRLSAPATTTYYNGRCTIGVPSSQAIYFECSYTGASTIVGMLGFCRWQDVISASGAADYIGGGTLGTNSIAVISDDTSGNYRTLTNGGPIFTGPARSSGSVLAIAYDPSTGRVWWRDSSGWVNSGNPVVGGGSGHVATFSVADIAIAYSVRNSCILDLNFGQRPFTYTPPTGFKALCTANLPAVAITNPRKHFDVIPYTGNVVVSGSQSITGASFTPDLVWLKARNQPYNHNLFDIIRGVQQELQSSSTGAETTQSTGLTAFISGGFTGGVRTNENATTYASWLWKANGAGVSNTAGSITSTVSANTTAGFSIVKFSAVAAALHTVGHGLGVAPKMIIAKYMVSGALNWYVYHANLTSAAYYLKLNLTDAQASDNTVWNSTAPTSTVFTQGNGAWLNGNTIAYCFAEIPGFSKFGSYTGNGSTDGPFVHCGFRPRYVMVKRSGSGAESWHIHDTARSTYNVDQATLYANSSVIEQTGATLAIDITASGFKVRTSDISHNAADTYIYAAFAEYPFGGSNIAPSPAR